jgi:hypothetical protein
VSELHRTTGDDDDPAYAALPRIVRELCSFEDDPTIPVLTWRSVILNYLFLVGSFPAPDSS